MGGEGLAVTAARRGRGEGKDRKEESQGQEQARSKGKGKGKAQDGADGEDCGTVANEEESTAIMDILENKGDLVKLRAGGIEFESTYEMALQVGPDGLVPFLAREFPGKADAPRSGLVYQGGCVYASDVCKRGVLLASCASRLRSTAAW